MERVEVARKLFAQARRMTLGMATSVVAYGAIGYYLVRAGKAGPAILNAPIYPLVKYGALIASAAGIFIMGYFHNRIFNASQAGAPNAERPPQKLLIGTILMGAGAELPVFLGFVLIFLGHHAYDYIPFAAISLAGFALTFPRKQQWSNMLGVDL